MIHKIEKNNNFPLPALLWVDFCRWASGDCDQIQIDSFNSAKSIEYTFCKIVMLP